VVYQDDLLTRGVGKLLRVGNFEVVQHELGLAVKVSCDCGFRLTHSKGILQGGIGYGRCYRIGIRALVPNYVDIFGQMKHLSIVNVELRLKSYWATGTAEALYRKINISCIENYINNRRIPFLSL
jgi:hypothetical protein